MRILVEGAMVRLSEPSDLRSLSIVARDPLHAVDDFRAWGTTDGRHAWVLVERLRAEVAALLPAGSWEAEFDAMIHFATGRSWISEDGTCVRAHLVSEVQP